MEFDQTFTTAGLWGRMNAQNFGVKRSRIKAMVGSKVHFLVTCWRRHN